MIDLLPNWIPCGASVEKIVAGGVVIYRVRYLSGQVRDFKFPGRNKAPGEGEDGGK